MHATRLRQLVCVLTTLLAALAVPDRVGAQVAPDLVSVDFSQRPDWAGEVWPADFDRDGVTDVTFLTTPAAGSALATARGRGDGTFDPAQVVATGTGSPIGVGDLNGDGLTDIVTASHVVPGRGDGSFDAPIAYATPSSTQIAPAQVVDMNGDGHTDVVRFAGSTGGSSLITGRVSIYPGNGDFTFGSPIAFNVGSEAESMIVVDVNGDAVPDIANTSKDFATRGVQLHVNAGNATFTTTNLPLPSEGGGISARDMNGDGITDLVVGMGDWGSNSSTVGFFIWTSGQVAVFLGLGGGAFSTPMTFPTLAGPIRLVAGDFNGDGIPDVATGNDSRVARCELYPTRPNSVSVLLGRGDGTLGPASSFALDSSRVQRLNTSDLDGDGRTDLLVSPGVVLLLRAARENHPPVVDAGPDKSSQLDSLLYNNRLFGSASDPDHDWLTFEWRDQTGRVFGDSPLTCVTDRTYQGRQDFTLTARDGRGGEASDTMQWIVLASSNSPVPAGFTGENIGDVGSSPGSSFYNNGVFIVSGSGADIWGTADAFRFVHTPMSGDFDVVTQIWQLANVDPWTKGGLMIRERLTAGSRHASVFATPTTVNGIAFQRREIENGGSVHTAGPALSPPVWLRLERREDTISAYYRVSPGEPWTLIGVQILDGLSDSVYVGMAVTSHRAGSSASAQFVDFAVTSTSTDPPPQPTGWQTADVGTVGAAGDVQFDGATYTVRGSGADIWGTTDAFRFVYVRVPGDGAIAVRVMGIAGPHAWSKGGLMIRQSLAANAAHHYLLASAANGLAYQRRLTTGESSLHTALGGAAPVWFHIVRSGGVVRLYYSTEPGIPTAWEPVAEAAFPEGEAFIGVAVTSHADGALATGVFEALSHTFTSSPPSSTAWTSADAGAVDIAGSAAFDGSTHTLAPSGADIRGTTDAFQPFTRTVNSSAALP